MHISPKRRAHTHMYSLSGHILDTVQDNPYLGLQISDDLKWRKHIQKTVNKASIALGMLRRNLKFLSKAHKSTAYQTLVRSILEYGSIVWDPHTIQDKQCLERIQRRAARFIVGDYKTKSEGFMTQTLKDIGLPRYTNIDCSIDSRFSTKSHMGWYRQSNRRIIYNHWIIRGV